MRRVLLAALLGTAALALPAGAAAGKPHAKPKPATFKPGTYSARAGVETFNVILKKARCASVPGQATAQHLCVSMPAPPTVMCRGTVTQEDSLGKFAPLAVPSSGKLLEQVTATGGSLVPGSPPASGPATFAITFTKRGTASGYFEQSLSASFETQAPIPCTTGRVAFTAKLL
jgi:hypothetical protein